MRLIHLFHLFHLFHLTVFHLSDVICDPKQRSQLICVLPGDQNLLVCCHFALPFELQENETLINALRTKRQMTQAVCSVWHRA